MAYRIRNVARRLAYWWVSTATVRESQVMGKAAVLVVVLCLSVPAMNQLFTDQRTSEVLYDAGDNLLLVIWAMSIMCACAFMVLSYMSQDYDNDRVWEIGALAMVVVAMSVYMTATYQQVGTQTTQVLLSVSAALTINSVGRILFLVRQIAWRRIKAKHGIERDDHLREPFGPLPRKKSGETT